MHKSRPSAMKKMRESALKQKRQDKEERRKQRRDNANQAAVDGEITEDGVEPATPAADAPREGGALDAGE